MIESIRFRPSTRTREAGVFNNLHSEGTFWKPAFLVLENDLFVWTDAPLVSPRNDFWETVTSAFRNSILLTCHYQNVGSASDWLKQISLATPPIRRTTQISVVTRLLYRISAVVAQTSFCGETSGGLAKCRLFSLAGKYHQFILAWVVFLRSSIVVESGIQCHYCSSSPRPFSQVISPDDVILRCLFDFAGQEGDELTIQANQVSTFFCKRNNRLFQLNHVIVFLFPLAYVLVWS